jgi:hypothetical protein
MENQSASNENQSPGSEPFIPPSTAMSAPSGSWCPNGEAEISLENIVYHYMKIAAEGGNHHAQVYCGRQLLSDGAFEHSECYQVEKYNAYLLVPCRNRNGPTNPDAVKALEYFKAGNKEFNSSVKGIVTIGLCYLYGIGCEPDYGMAFQRFDAAYILSGGGADEGGFCTCCKPKEIIAPDIIFLKGEALLRSLRDEEGAEQMRLSYEGGYYRGTIMWAICNWLGVGVPKNPEVALKIISKKGKDESLSPTQTEVMNAIQEELPPRSSCCLIQ